MSGIEGYNLDDWKCIKNELSEQMADLQRFFHSYWTSYCLFYCILVADFATVNTAVNFFHRYNLSDLNHIVNACQVHPKKILTS